MSNIDELYQEIILEHNQKPKNFFKLQNPTHYAKGLNPFCGDQIEIFYIVNSKLLITNISFIGYGCAISKASASIMISLLSNSSVKEALILYNNFHEFLIKKHTKLISSDLLVFKNIKKFPIRIKCAMIPWHAFKIALNK